VPLVRTDDSESISPPSSGFLRVQFSEDVYHSYRRENIAEDDILQPYIISVYEEVN
jgi:hypothetical protein